MKAAMDKHRLSSLALGHKHRHGIDGVPVDREQSYGIISSFQMFSFFIAHYVIPNLFQTVDSYKIVLNKLIN